MSRRTPLIWIRAVKPGLSIYMYYGMKVGEYPEELQSVWAFVKEELENGTPPG